MLCHYIIITLGNVKVITMKQAGNRETPCKDRRSTSTYNVRHIFKPHAQKLISPHNTTLHPPRTHPVLESLLSNFGFRLHNCTAKLELLLRLRRLFKQLPEDLFPYCETTFPQNTIPQSSSVSHINSRVPFCSC